MSRSVLLDLARESIEEVFQAEISIDRDSLLTEFPILAEKVATFVTLWLDDEIRGSSGEVIAQRSLLDDIIHNAKTAAFEDPLFSPLTTSEYLHTRIEISVLSVPKAVEYLHSSDLDTKIRSGIDGILLSSHSHQATVLPQRWDEYTEVADMLAHLGEQAGLGKDVLRLHPDIFIYQAETAVDEPMIKRQRTLKAN